MRRKLVPLLIVVALVLVIAIVTVLLMQPKPAPDAPVTPSDITVSEPTAGPTPGMPAVAAPDATASADEVVRYYFERWNAKDAAGMDASRIEEDAGLYPYDDMPYEEAIVVESIRLAPQAEADEQFDTEWYPGAAQVAKVVADFFVDYNDDGQAMYMTDGIEHKGYVFWLVKDAEGRPWRIVQQGYY